jgi:hypothetical protein
MLLRCVNCVYYLTAPFFGHIQSLEVKISPYEVERVLRRLAIPGTVVVGPVLEGHEFRSAGKTAITLMLCTQRGSAA